MNRSRTDRFSFYDQDDKIPALFNRRENKYTSQNFVFSYMIDDKQSLNKSINFPHSTITNQIFVS